MTHIVFFSYSRRSSRFKGRVGMYVEEQQLEQKNLLRIITTNVLYILKLLKVYTERVVKDYT